MITQGELEILQSINSALNVLVFQISVITIIFAVWFYKANRN